MDSRGPRSARQWTDQLSMPLGAARRGIDSIGAPYFVRNRRPRYGRLISRCGRRTTYTRSTCMTGDSIPRLLSGGRSSGRDRRGHGAASVLATGALLLTVFTRRLPAQEATPPPELTFRYVALSGRVAVDFFRQDPSTIIRVSTALVPDGLDLKKHPLGVGATCLEREPVFEDLQQRNERKEDLDQRIVVLLVISNLTANEYESITTYDKAGRKQTCGVVGSDHLVVQCVAARDRERDAGTVSNSVTRCEAVLKGGVTLHWEVPIPPPEPERLQLSEETYRSLGTLKLPASEPRSVLERRIEIRLTTSGSAAVTEDVTGTGLVNEAMEEGAKKTDAENMTTYAPYARTAFVGRL